MMRHAESHGNATGDYSTDNHDSLSEHGWQQAESAIQRLKQLDFSTIYCSALLRTQETIFPFLKQENRQAKIWAAISEACYQEETATDPVPNGPRDAFEPDPHVATHLGHRDPSVDVYRPSDLESYAHGLFRVQATAATLNEHYRHQDRNLLLVSHGFFLSMLIDTLLELEPARDHVHHDNTGLSCLSFIDGRWRVRYLNRL